MLEASVNARPGVQAVTARLNALENDNTAAEEVAAASDDEFDLDEESEEERSSDEEDKRLGYALGYAVPAHQQPRQHSERADFSCSGFYGLRTHALSCRSGRRWQQYTHALVSLSRCL